MSRRISVNRSPLRGSLMNTVMVTRLATLPPARLSVRSIWRKISRAWPSKFPTRLPPWPSWRAVWPASQTIRPPSVMTAGEKARDFCRSLPSRYSADSACADKPAMSAKAQTSRKLTRIYSSAELIASGYHNAIHRGGQHPATDIRNGDEIWSERAQRPPRRRRDALQIDSMGTCLTRHAMCLLLVAAATGAAAQDKGMVEPHA